MAFLRKIYCLVFIISFQLLPMSGETKAWDHYCNKANIPFTEIKVMSDQFFSCLKNIVQFKMSRSTNLMIKNNNTITHNITKTCNESTLFNYYHKLSSKSKLCFSYNDINIKNKRDALYNVTTDIFTYIIDVIKEKDFLTYDGYKAILNNQHQINKCFEDNIILGYKFHDNHTLFDIFIKLEDASVCQRGINTSACIQKAVSSNDTSNNAPAFINSIYNVIINNPSCNKTAVEPTKQTTLSNTVKTTK